MNAPVWQLDSVSLLGRGRPRLDAVSLDIQPGVTALLGASGAGKTSLLNLLVDFERPSAGRVVFNSRSRYWSPQDGGLWPHLTVAAHLDAVQPSRDQPAVDRLLNQFDLTACADARPGTLSMGERSRLSIARTLASGADVLVMDEPLAHVDPARVGKYRSAVRRHVQQHGVTLVFATHSPETVLAEAQQVVCLDGGRVLFDGRVDDLYWRPANEQFAGLMGAANWFEPADAAIWFANGNAPPGDQQCVRPERLRIESIDQSPLIVRDARFCGSFAEAEVEHTACQERRTFTHRPADASLKAGDRVALRVIALLLLCVTLGLAGCKDDAAHPPLDIKQVKLIPLTPDGGKLPGPRGLGIGKDGSIIAVDTAGRVLIFDTRGRPVRDWRMPESDVGRAEGVIQLQDGRIAVADTHYHRIVLFDAEGNLLSMFGDYGHDPGQFVYPNRLCQDADGYLYVSEYGGNDRVQKFAPDGTHVLTIGSVGTDPGQFQRPSGLAWHDGTLYISDAGNNVVHVYRDDGKYVGPLGTDERGEVKDPSWSLDIPYDLAIGPDGLLYVIEFGSRMTVLTLDGRLAGRIGRPGRGRGDFATPWAVAVDGERRVWVADTGNRRIVEFDL